MQIGTHLGMLATILAVFALAIGSVAVLEPSAFHGPGAGPAGPAGPAGAPGQNGHDGANGTNGQNGSAGANGQNGTAGLNGTNGVNGTTWTPLWYAFAPTFESVGALTYLEVTPTGCSDMGQGANYCLINVTNTCGPEAGLHTAWACASSYYALVNVSYPINGTFYFTGADPSLGYALGWGQSVTIQLWFQTVVFSEYASGAPAPVAPVLAPVIDLGFAAVSG